MVRAGHREISLALSSGGVTSLISSVDISLRRWVSVHREQEGSVLGRGIRGYCQRVAICLNLWADVFYYYPEQSHVSLIFLIKYCRIAVLTQNNLACFCRLLAKTSRIGLRRQIYPDTIDIF